MPATVELVVAFAAEELVVTFTTTEKVVSISAVDHVVADSPKQRIRELCPENSVIATTTVDRGALERREVSGRDVLQRNPVCKVTHGGHTDFADVRGEDSDSRRVRVRWGSSIDEDCTTIDGQLDVVDVFHIDGQQTVFEYRAYG